MKPFLLCIWLAFVAGFSSHASAQADVALVNRVSGEASYTSASSSANPVTAFIRVRDGDRFTLARGAQVRVVYMQGGRQETWTGPASFRAGEKQSEAVRGKPELSQLPVMVAVKMGRIPNLMQSARLGGVTVRGGARPVPLTAEEVDVAPEIFLFSVLQEYGQFDELKALAQEMRRRQPASAEVRELADWAESRAGPR